ncbi:MAG TPA: ABC transporter permease, partial [Nitrosopumilaceae archaeon]|nr:ABC transporter permease [Nitrosopumilaceae archaeon]
MNEEVTDNHWDTVILPKSSIFNLRLKELFRYKDLLFLFVKRDIVSTYKQTVLGPVWFFLQPVLTTLVFTVIFGNIAKLSTDGCPAFIFYLSGITLWNYFADCFNKTSDTFSANQSIFGKVYFPRLIVPLSIVVSNLVRLMIQLILFYMAFIYFAFYKGSIHPNIYMLLTPVLVFIMALLGLGFGLFFTSMTTKYRDLKFLLQFGIQLMMYGSPII